MQLSEKLQNLTPYSPVQDACKIRLDANESFVPLPQNIRQALVDAVSAMAFNRYPDPAAAEACAAFADFHGLSPSQIVAGNGSDELITILFSAFLEKGDAFATIQPDFSMYGFYGQLCEGRHISIQKEKDFSVKVDRVIETCNNEGVKLLVFSNPCNPTSLGIKREEVRRLVRSVQALVVLDEAYMDFWDESLLGETAEHENLVILKTCSKAFGMAGIRLGFAVAQPPLVSLLMAAKSPYNVNAFSQAAGTVLLRHKAQAREAFARILRSKQDLEQGLLKIAAKTAAFSVLPGHANFVTLSMAQPEVLHRYLLGQSIAVRCTSGLLRITCATAEENAALLKAVKDFTE